MLSFNFRGKDSYIDFGILIQKKPPIPMAERNVIYEEVPGRNGSLSFDYRTYKDIILPIECSFISDAFKGKANEIKAWLMGVPDKLIFSDDVDKYYEAQVVNKFDIVESISKLGEFPVIFNCKPFKKIVNDFNLYKLCEVSNSRNSIVINPLDAYNYTSGTLFNANELVEINKTAEFVFVNTGTIESKPLIKLTGTGDITLTVNSRSFSILALNGEIIINSELEDAYNDIELLNNKMVGEFPFFNVGENLISYTGSLTSIEIQPNTQFI